MKLQERREPAPPSSLEASQAQARPPGSSRQGAWRSSPVLRLLGHFTDPPLDDGEIHRVRGVPARLCPPRLQQRTLRVVTWNIERGTRFDRLLRALEILDADLYLLQEVDMFCRRSRSRDVARDLAERLRTNWVYAGEFQEIGEASNGVPALTGQAVLSRHPIEEASVIRFAAQARFRWSLSPIEPRRGGRIALKVRAAGIVAYNAHMESVGADRIRREQLDEVLADTRMAREDTPVVIAGDFNTGPAARSSMVGALGAAAFADALSENGARRTSVRRNHQLDWIFVKNLPSGGGHIFNTGQASDHYPVLARLVLGGELPSDLAGGRPRIDEPYPRQTARAEDE